jgi:hypothetical protein
MQYLVIRVTPVTFDMVKKLSSNFDLESADIEYPTYFLWPYGPFPGPERLLTHEEFHAQFKPMMDVLTINTAEPI